MDLDLGGKVAVVTGGGGAIGGAIAHGLAREGARVAVWDISLERAQAKALEVGKGTAVAVSCDATDREEVERAVEHTVKAFGQIDLLVNGAGGSSPQTTTSGELDFADIGTDAMRDVISLNYLSAVVVSQEIGRIFTRAEQGAIVNIASVAGLSPLTRALSYSDGKAALVSHTRWLAVHMAHEYSARIRVNAIAPGFILTDQNRFLLVDEESGDPTERGKQIIDHVPQKRLGSPDDTVGAVLWLLSDRASFVTGAVVSVDGGFSAYSGV